MFLFCSQIFVLNQLKIVFPFLPSTVITIITAHCFTQLLTFKWQVIARHQNLLVAILIQPIAFGLESISFCLNSDFTLGFNSNSTNHSYWNPVHFIVMLRIELEFTVEFAQFMAIPDDQVEFKYSTNFLDLL